MFHLLLQVTFQQSERTEDGASAVEYGLLVAGIAALIVAAVFAFGGFMNELMGESCGTIMGFVTGADCSE